MQEYLIISTNVDLVRVLSDDIMYISSDGNYSSFFFKYGESRVVTKQLGQVEEIIQKQLVNTGTNFIRIGKSLIINKMYVSYINLSRLQLVLFDGYTANHTLTASKMALSQLKELIEEDIKK